MRKSIHLAACFILACPIVAQAAPVLIAHGTYKGNGADKSGLSAPMENGQAQNILGGTGSGFAYAGGNTFLALPDRGPNATPYNGAIDNTTSYISRFHTMTMELTASAPGDPLPFKLAPVMNKTTLLFSGDALAYGTGAGLGNKIDGITPIGSGAPSINDATHHYFSGRSDNFNPAKTSTDPFNGRLDPEGIRVSNDGKSIFISDEYGPYVRQFDRASGALIKTFNIPANLIANVQAPIEKGATGEIALNAPPAGAGGRTTNKGMEGLAITPDGKTLVGAMQAALIQESGKDTKKLVRLVTIDIETGATKQYGYMLTAGSGISEITALNDHQFLVDERDGVGLGGDPVDAKTPVPIKRIFLIDIAGATDITNVTAANAIKNGQVVAKSGTPFLDVSQALVDALGINYSDVPSKIEGLAFGQDVMLNGELTHTLWVTNDNDYLPDEAGPNKFYVFGVTDKDLANAGASFSAQNVAAVPEPASWALMIGGFAFAGSALRRRKLSVRFA